MYNGSVFFKIIGNVHTDYEFWNENLYTISFILSMGHIYIIWKKNEIYSFA